MIKHIFSISALFRDRKPEYVGVDYWHAALYGGDDTSDIDEFNVLMGLLISARSIFEKSDTRRPALCGNSDAPWRVMGAPVAESTLCGVCYW